MMSIARIALRTTMKNDVDNADGRSEGVRESYDNVRDFFLCRS